MGEAENRGKGPETRKSVISAEFDARNLRPEFKNVATDEIRRILAARRRKFSVLAINTENDFNLGSILRSHNAFLGSHFYYLGQKRYYKPGTVGTHHYEPITYLENFEVAREKIPGDHIWVGVDNAPNAISLQNFDWPENPLIVLGNEHEGLDFCPELKYHCKYVVAIPQLGSVRSLNVAVAAGIVLYDLCLQQGWL